MKKVITGTLMLLSLGAQAELVSTDQYGFAVKLERIVPVSKEVAYQQFLNVGQWWNKDHTWFGVSENLYIEPKVQGCFCEVAGQKQALHMTVSYVDPNNEMRMTGGLGPLQSLGIHGGMIWKFDKTDDGKTKITFDYKVIGVMGDGSDGGLKNLAPVVDKVLTLQLDNLAAKLK